MKKCPKCDKTYDDTWKVCLNCKDSALVAEASETKGYCVKCKTSRDMEEIQIITMTNGSEAMRGKCPICKTGMYKIAKYATIKGEPSDTSNEDFWLTIFWGIVKLVIWLGVVVALLFLLVKLVKYFWGIA